MYRYDQIDRDMLADRTAEFRGQVARRLAGELTEDQFKPLRLRNGLYLQLHAYMLRISVPYGSLNPAQLRMLAWIGRTKDTSIQALCEEYTKRASRYVQIETQEFPSEEALLKWIGKARPFFVALDSRGKQLSSAELAEFIGNHQDRGTQAMLFAIGSSDGFSEAALKASQYQLSMGKMTLPHELALVVLSEQIYRAFTILKGHPYHTGP